MSFERGLLGFLAVFVVVAGIGCLLAPGSFAQQAGFSLNSSALTEIRAFYGGLQLGIAGFLIWCLRDPGRTSTGLLLGGLAVGGAGLGRVVGMAIDEVSTTHHLANLGIESATVAVVVVALKRLAKTESAA